MPARDAITTAGRLRQRVTLEAPPEPQDTDAYGDPNDIWVAVADVAAEVEELGGTRLIAAQQLTADATYTVTVRWRPGVTPRMRLNYGGKLLNVLSVQNPDSLKIWLVMHCGEWVRG